jgi:adenylyl-sulfate kinase
MSNRADQHRGFVLWFTGLSGAGKSTLAERLTAEFKARGYRVELLDGDEVRTHLSKGLGFSKEDRDTNVRRIGWVARVLARNGVIAITAAISPYRDIREEIREAAEQSGTPFIEVYANAPIDVVTQRDVKGLYRKALAGELPQFTGVTDPYEPPLNPDVTAYTARDSIDESITDILRRLSDRDLIESIS